MHDIAPQIYRILEGQIGVLSFNSIINRYAPKTTQKIPISLFAKTDISMIQLKVRSSED